MAIATVDKTELKTDQRATGVVVYANEDVRRESEMFVLAQQKANIYSKSTLVPKEYQNNVGNVLIATNMAHRMKADILAVMQNLYIVHGKPGWSAQFLIATFNSCGRFSAIKYRFDGTPGAKDWGCVAYATELETGETIEGTKVTIAIAEKEGWLGKNGSKWQTIPEQMMRYRAATFMIRTTAPEIGMGLMTKEELDDLGPTEQAPVRGMKGLESRLAEIGGTQDIDVPETNQPFVADEPEETETPDSLVDKYAALLRDIDTQSRVKLAFTKATEALDRMGLSNDVRDQVMGRLLNVTDSKYETLKGKKQQPLSGTGDEGA